MLKAEATGPSVPAIKGNADDANHHRLYNPASAGEYEQNYTLNLPYPAKVGVGPFCGVNS